MTRSWTTRETNRSSSAVPDSVHDVVRSPGQPLDAETRAFMEPRFGHDFSQVRVHADEPAAESALDVGALAYTVGRDVVFAAGRYAPRTASGRALLAHELAHVVQQSGSAPGGLAVSQPHDPSEQLADRAAQAVAPGGASAKALAVGMPQIAGPLIQRQEGPKGSTTKFKSVEDKTAQKELEEKVAAYMKQGKGQAEAIALAMDDMFAERVEATGGKRLPRTATLGTPGERTFLDVPQGIVYEGTPLKSDFYNASIDDTTYNCHSYTFYEAKQTKLDKLKKLALKIPKEGGALAGKPYFDAAVLVNNGIHFELGPPTLIYPRWVLDSEAREQLKGYSPLTTERKAKGDIVMYSMGGDLPHSGRVTAVDKQGNVTITSKWGHLSLFQHAPEAVPAHYGTPTFYRKKK